MVDISQPKELVENNVLRVNEETSRLRKVLMWGRPGVETVLAQLLPTDISCFQTQFNVPKAREEFDGAKSILEKNGIEVIEVKKLLAKMIDDQGYGPTRDLKGLRSDIQERALSYAAKYRDKEISDVEEVSEWIDGMLESDMETYGEKTAILMNELVTLNNDLPISNLMYARDQSNLLGETMVWSSMKHPIRQPEVHLFKHVLNYNGILESKGLQQIQVTEDGRFEGGDGIANAGIFYIGVGGRTNVSGVMQAAESIIGKGGRVMIAIDEERDMGANEMDAMHLDTYWMPVSHNQIVACDDEVKRRKIIEVVGNPLTGLYLKQLGWFADHLERRNVELIPLTKAEQEAYAPNFLNLGDKKVVLSLADGNNLTKELEGRGFTVFNADLKEITKGFGGLHCSTAAIQRD
jgi:arginine deiminase